VSRTFFIGDVHGCVEELAELVEKFSPNANDNIYQTGDLINKGPSSLAVVEFILKRGIKCVMGNHEAKLLNILGKPSAELTPKDQKFLENLQNPQWIGSVVSQFPLWMDTGKEILLHAGLEPGKRNLQDMSASSILTIRLWNEKPWYEQADFSGRTIIFGHWAMNGLIDFPNAKGLDTGCVYGKLLTGYCPEENKFYQVAAKKSYAAGKGIF
jgi:bis(5'-nucleosyl)-tetraphosphatase (symmetrical)